MRADVLCSTIRETHERMEHSRRDLHDLGHRAHAVTNADLCSTPRRELITVAATSCKDVRNHLEKLETYILRSVANPGGFERWRIRVSSKPVNVERTQRACEHVELPHADRPLYFEEHTHDRSGGCETDVCAGRCEDARARIRDPERDIDAWHSSIAAQRHADTVVCEYLDRD